MSIVTRLSPALLTVAILLAGPASGTTRDERRQDIRDIVHATLERFYKADPRAKDVIEKSAGYAVFGNFGMKIVPGGGQGSGIAVNRKSGQETFMKMVGVPPAPGAGAKSFGLVWVFENESKFNDFVKKGFVWAPAAPVAPAQGSQLHAGAVSISPDIWIYQLNDDGLAKEVTFQGTKYKKAGGLNQE